MEVELWFNKLNMKQIITHKTNLNMNIIHGIKTIYKIGNPLKYKMISNVQVVIDFKFRSQLWFYSFTRSIDGIYLKHFLPQEGKQFVLINASNSITYIKFMSYIPASPCQ